MTDPPDEGMSDEEFEELNEQMRDAPEVVDRLAEFLEVMERWKNEVARRLPLPPPATVHPLPKRHLHPPRPPLEDENGDPV